MGFLNEHSTNVMCACIGAIVAAIIFIIPDYKDLSYAYVFCTNVADIGMGITTSNCWTNSLVNVSLKNYGSWFLALTIIFAISAVLFIVFLVLMFLTAGCCPKWTCDNYFFSLALGLLVVSAAGYLSVLLATEGRKSGISLEASRNLMTFLVYARWNNITYIILPVIFFLVSIFVKNWTCCKKTIIAVVGCILAFLLSCVYTGARMDPVLNDKELVGMVMMVLNGAVAAGVFALLFVFTSISSCLGKNCMCCCCCH